MSGPPGRGARILRLAVLAVVAPGLASVTACSDQSPEDVWTLVWADEFDGPAGRLPDASWWSFDVGTDWGNGQLEYDTDRAENVSLDGNGKLSITAREESFQGRQYTSGRIKTKGLFEHGWGRFEARMLLPGGQGIWPAFWLLGSDIDEVGWPASGEIDVMEYRGQEPSVVHGTLHGPGYSGSRGITRSYELPTGRFDTGFHTFAIEWTRQSIEWYVDGVSFYRVARADVPGEWVFDDPFFILLNVAVGGTFAQGAPDGTTPFPRTMLVDWVRVYERRS